MLNIYFYFKWPISLVLTWLLGENFVFIYFYFRLLWVFTATLRRSLVAGAGLLFRSSWALSLPPLLWLWSIVSKVPRLCCCRWLPWEQNQWLWLLAVVTPRHVGSSQTGIQPVFPALAGRFFFFFFFFFIYFY